MGAVLHNGSPDSCYGVVGEGMPSKDLYIEFSQAVNVTFHSKWNLADGIKALILERSADGHHVIIGTPEEDMRQMQRSE